MVNYQSLVGLQWDYGTTDCYSLLKNYYKLLGIELPEYIRPLKLETCESIFLDQLPKKGFEEIPFNERLPNDVLLMRIGTKTPMHAAILLPNERILHQKRNSLSRIEPFSAYYVNRTEAIFRYATGNTPR